MQYAILILKQKQWRNSISQFDKKKEPTAWWRHKLLDNYITFEIPITVTVKSNIFWDVTPCSSVEVHRRFGRKYFIFRIEE
jgi:hypothetical protein